MGVKISTLFEPLDVKGHTLRNRVVMPPMITDRGIVSRDGISWYGEHAAGGVALVIVEATPVTQFGHELSAENLRTLLEAIHDGGALAAVQLFPVSWTRGGVAPGDLSREKIEQIIGCFEMAAGVCATAGFDGIEPHGAHVFLLNQFFSPAENARVDGFGGSLQNRMRMGIEVVRACRRGLGNDRLLLYRHTPVKEGSYPAEDSLAFAERLVEEGVDILDISPASDRAPADQAQPFRRFGVPVIGAGQMDEVERALEALTEGRADLIAVGRGLIADPLWPKKVQERRFDDIVPRAAWRREVT